MNNDDKTRVPHYQNLVLIVPRDLEMIKLLIPMEVN